MILDVPMTGVKMNTFIDSAGGGENLRPQHVKQSDNDRITHHIDSEKDGTNVFQEKSGESGINRDPSSRGKEPSSDSPSIVKEVEGTSIPGQHFGNKVGGVVRIDPAFFFSFEASNSRVTKLVRQVAPSMFKHLVNLEKGQSPVGRALQDLTNSPSLVKGHML